MNKQTTYYLDILEIIQHEINEISKDKRSFLTIWSDTRDDLEGVGTNSQHIEQNLQKYDDKINTLLKLKSKMLKMKGAA